MNRFFAYQEDQEKCLKELYQDTKIGPVPVSSLQDEGISLDKQFIKEKFENGYDFKKLRHWGDIRIQKLADWCGFTLKPKTKLTHLLLVSGEPCGFTDDKQWANEWAQQLEGRSTMEISQIKRHKSLLPA